MAHKLALAALLAACSALSARAIGDDGVTALDSSDFKLRVGKDVPALVEFYAPWCGHCKNLAPEYKVLAETFKSAAGSVLIAKVDADAHKDLAGEFDVKGFPTLKWFPAGSLTPEDVNAERTADALAEFVNGKTGLAKRVKKEPSAVVALTPETFDAAFHDKTSHKLIEFYAPWCGHCKHLAPTYEKLGLAFEGEPRVLIAKVDADAHRSLGERFGVSGFPTLKYFRAGEGTPEVLAETYEGGRELPDFVKFLNEKSGAERTEDGGLLPTAGRLPEFDKLAKEFAAASGAARDAVAKKALSASEAFFEEAADRAKAKAYVALMDKIAKKPAGWVETESKRLGKMASSEGLTKAKKIEIQGKISLLAAFAA